MCSNINKKRSFSTLGNFYERSKNLMFVKNTFFDSYSGGKMTRQGQREINTLF